MVEAEMQQAQMKTEGEKEPSPPSEESIQTKAQKPTSGLSEDQKN